MADCKIEKNKKNGKINKVVDAAGNPSKLFQQILNVPTLSLTEAIDVYKNIYSEQLKAKVQINYSKSIADNSVQQAIQTAVQRNNGNPLNLAPNGKPSILYQSYKDLGYSEQGAERLTAQVYSDSFLDFFGDWLNNPQNASKVVDENGQPLLTWHNSKNNFNKFKKTKGKRTSLAGVEDVESSGFFFAKDKEFANAYGDIVYPSFLNIRNIFDISQGDGKQQDLYKKVTGRDMMSDMPFGIEGAWEYFDGDEFDISESVIKNKFDGVNIYEKSPENSNLYSDVFIAFNPNQIKSATENIGTFSTDSNDIRYQIIGEKGAQNLDQIEEATFRMDNLKVAREMEAAGKTPKEIRLATGWEKNSITKEWQFELQDNYTLKTLKINNKTVGQVVDYPELLNAFPKIKDVKIEVVPFEDVDFDGNYQPNRNVIQISSYLVDEDSRDQLISVLAHELQHKTQELEGWKPSSRQDAENYAQGLRGIGLVSPYSDVEDNSVELLDDELKEFARYSSVEGFLERPNSLNMLKLLKYYFNKDWSLGSKGQETIGGFTIGGVSKKVYGYNELSAYPNTKQGLIDFLTNELSELKVRAGVEPNLSKQELEKKLENTEQDSFEADDLKFIIKSIDNFNLYISEIEKGNFSVKASTQPSLLLDVKDLFEQYKGDRKEVSLKFLSERIKDFFDENELDAFEVYWKSQTEVEARNVQSRMNMSAEERRQTLLEETEDVAREDQIFLMDNLGGSQMSFSPQKGQITQEIIDKLKQNGLSEDVFLLSTEEINAKLKELGVSEDVRRQVDAYHGSPYSFDRFEFSDRTFLTGEKAAAFGAGLYFTDIESIARNYATVLADVKPIEYIKINGRSLERSHKYFKEIEQGISNYEELLGKQPNTVSDIISFMDKSDLKNRLEKGELTLDFKINNLPNRNLYKVSLHKGKEVGEYNWLEWDTQTSKETKEKFSSVIKNENLNGEIHNIKLSDKYDVESFDGGKTWKVGDTTKIGTEEEFIATFKDKKQAEQEAYKLNFVESSITGRDLYEALAKQIGQKEASLFLLENGIDGIKYPAESISRGATSDTARGFNYVVFDENAITIEEQIQFSKSLNNVGINLITNGLTYKDSKTGKDIVILNKDTADDSTLLHEYQHLFLNWAKTARPELYAKGIDLIKKELKKGDKSEIKDIFDFVKQTQPTLTGNALLEEYLTEYVGRESRNMMDEQKQKSPLMQWLSNFWDEIRKSLGLLSMTPEQVANLNLKDFARASVVDLLKGENINNNLNNKQNGQTAITILGEPRGDRRRWNPSRGNQTLEGAPINTKRKNVTGADPELTYWAEEYAKRNGLDYKRQSKYVEVDTERAERIAEEYDKMEHNPQDPKVKEAYQNLINQTVAQYNVLVEAGYQFYFFDETNDPYDGNPMSAMEELRNEKQMGSFSTEAGFGTGNEGIDVSDNPMLQDTGIEWGWGSVRGEKRRVLANDLFRVVHDSFGHGLEGAGFRARGEENAWQAHARLFTGSARAAITSETRGQNSWLNFGKYAEQNRNAKVGDTIFAPQKTGLMPEWTWQEGFDEGTQNPDTRYQIIGEQGASRIEQYQQSLNQAKQLDRQGMSTSEIEQKTGWYKYKGLWKTLPKEVLESFSIRNNTKDKVLKLKEVLNEGNKIFEFYPELNNTKVVFVGRGVQGMEMPENLENGNGAYNEASGTILINTVFKGIAVGDREQKYTLAHEMQHAIQKLEQHPRGGHIESILDEAMEILSIKSERLSDIFNEIKNADKSKLTENEKLIVEASLQTITAIEKGDTSVLKNQYKHLLGEIDANVVEGALKIKDNQNIIAKSYSELLNVYAQWKKIDLNKVFLLKNGNIRFSVIGEKGASKIEEYNNLLNQAKQLEKQGVSTQEIENQTGWFKNEQGQWKYFSNEILNEFLDFPKIKNKTVNLKDLLKEDSILLKAYPQLNNVKVEFYEGTKGNDFRRDGQINGTVTKAGEKVTIHARTDQTDGGNSISTIGHEVAHLLQSLEGFARGGSPNAFVKIASQIAGVKETDSEVVAREKINSLDVSTLNKDEKRIISIVRDVIKTNSVKLLKDSYYLLQGEIDARAVELSIELKQTIDPNMAFSYSNLVKKLGQVEGIDVVNQAINIFIDDINLSKAQNKQTVKEPKATFNGFNTYSEAVKNTPINDPIKIDIEGINIGEVTNSGDINDLIRQDIIVDERELTPSGDIVFVTKGNSLTKKLINAEIASETIKGRINEEGNIVEREKVDLTKVSEDFNKNKKEFGESVALTILGSQILAKYTPTFGNNRIVDFSVDVPTETVLMEKLKNLMQQLGIKTMSIESWEKNFEKRTGKKPTANSLADISGKIIAFSNGEITQDMLTEEVMHFVVEALPQEEIQPLLDMIHKTDEWKEYAQQYSEIYQNDDTVRREILGKVLKNRIQGKAEQSTLQGQSITRRLAEIIGRFFEKVRGFLKPQHLQQIDKFTDEIYKRLMADELYSDLSPEQFEGNNLVMYQTSADPIYDHLSDTIDKFEKLDRETGRQNKFELTLLDIENRDEAHQLRTVSALSSMIKTKVKYLTKRGRQGGFLSMEEQSVYDVAINELAPTLGKLKNIVSEKVVRNSTLKQMVMEQATEAITSLSELTTALNEDNDRVFETLVEDVALQTGLTPEMTEVLKNEMRTIQRDTNQFFSLYGSLSQAQNPILNLLSVVISDTERESVIQFDKRQSEFINQAKAIGFSDEEIAGKLKEFKDGYYFISEYDFPEIERQEAIFKAEVYNSITGAKLSAEELLEDESNLIKKLPKKSQTTYNFKVKEGKDRSGMYLDRLTKEERKKADELIEGFSEKTKLFLANQAKRKGEIMQRIGVNGGASMEDNFLLKDIAKERQQMSNPYDENGYLYKGLTMDSEGNLTLNEKFEKLTNDSDKERVMTILELANYNKKIVEQYKEKERLNGKQTVPQSFIDKIQELRGNGDFEGVKKATEFLRLNTRISYNGDFWDSFEKTNGLVEKLRETLDKEAIKIADDIARDRSRLKNILKENREYNNPSQIDFENLGGAESTIKDIMDSLEYNYEKAKSHLKEEKTDKKESSSESITNDAYKKVIGDRGLKVTDRKSYEEKLSFILRHVTPKNRRRIEKTAENFIRYKKGVYDTVPKGFENFYNESQNIKEFKDNVEVYNDIISYAESMLLPYFKELKPADFNMNQFISQLVSAKTKVEFNRIIEEAKYLSVTPSYALIDAEDNNRLNPEYTEAFEAGNPTVNLDFKDKNGNKILRNKRYSEMFLDANGKIRKEKEKDKQLLDLAVSFWADSIKSSGMEGKHSKYQLPGIRRNSLARKEQLIKNFSVKNLKESIKDIITVREDDPIFGQASDIGARGSLKIPRIGFSKLESADEVTDEILYSLMHTANQAEKRKQRVASLHKIEAVKTRLRGASYGDKSGESTEAYKMADDFTRYNIYGQTETFKWETDFGGLTSKKYNLAPVIKHFQGWARLVGIGFSTLVPLTSFLQGSINFFVENIVGDRINPTASRLASKKAGQLLSRAIKEEFMSEIKTKSELNLLMQFFGLANPIDNFKNTNSGRVLRGLAPENSAYFSHYMGDVPLTAQTLMTVLYDFKVVEDAKTKEMKLQSYSEWRNDNRALVITSGAAPVTESQALSEWKLNQNYLYNYIEIDKNAVGDISGMKMNDEYYKIFAGKEKYANERLNFVKRKIQTTKQEIDNQIPNEDKANIQRHAIYSFISMFKGFLITSINKRLKMRHDSFHTNEMEEGTYRGTSEFLAALINKGKKNKDGKRQSFKDFWREQYRAFDGGYKLVKEGGEWNVYNTNKEGNPKVFSSQDESSAKSAHAQLQVRATQMRQTSLKRAGMDLAVTTALATIALIAKQMADDDDDDYVKEFIAYMTYRVAVETTSQSAGLPGQIYSFLQSPTAGLSQVNNLINIGDVFSGDVIKQGTYRDYSEREAWMYRSLPIMKEYFRLKEIDRSRQDYKKYNKHFIDNFNMAALIFDEESRK